MLWLWGSETKNQFFLDVKTISGSLLFPEKFKVKSLFARFKIDGLYPDICFYLRQNDIRGKDTFFAHSLNLTPIPPAQSSFVLVSALQRDFLTVSGADSYYRVTDKVCN